MGVWEGVGVGWSGSVRGRVWEEVCKGERVWEGGVRVCLR